SQVFFSPTGEWLAASSGADARVFDTRTWGPVTIPGPDVNSISFDPTGPRLATATESGDASIWELPSGSRLRHLQEVGDKVNHIAFSPDGAYVVTAGGDGAERVWETREGKLKANLKIHRGEVRWAEFSPTSKLVVSTGEDRVVAISD